MKCKFYLILLILIAVVFTGCFKSGSGSSNYKENFDKDASYALGMNIGTSISGDGIFPNIDELVKGIKDTMTGKESRFTSDEAMTLIETAYYSMMEQKNIDEKQKEISFLAENSKKSGVMITPSGLQYEIINEVKGRKPSTDDFVQVHYEGKLIDGMVFDSSYNRGEPAEFPLNGVISGWTEGLQMMGIGSKYRFYIPSEQGYGPNGWGNIPPYATLIFEVELLDILENY
jgi:FKBP-type peptidyl-prolyl cis-trans isomerase